MIGRYNIKKIPLSLFILLGFFSSCHKKPPPPKMRILPIQKQVVSTKVAYNYIETIGHVDPITSVDIRSRVEGELLQVHFCQGQEVKKNDLLFTIDPRPFEAKLKETMANLEKNKANLKQAKDKLFRYTPLLKEEYISQLDYDQLVTDVETLTAAVEENHAQIDMAKLNIEYAHIYSPLGGKTGILKIDQGNMISPNEKTALVTINQLQPIYVLFAVAEKDLLSIQRANKKKSLSILVTFDAFTNHYYKGKLVQIDSQVDTKTAMIKLRALFKNTQKELWPGKFVKVRVILRKIENAVVIPYQAIQITTDGPIVFVVQEDNTVKMKHVVLGQRQDDNIIIEKGLQKGEIVVTEGQLNLFDGASVYVPKSDKKAES